MKGFPSHSAKYQDPALATLVDEQLPEPFMEQRLSHSSLLELGEKLELTSAKRVRYNGFVFRLTDIIQERIQVARFYVSGSYGRRVTVAAIEIDLVVFLRNSDYLPPYTKSNDSLLIKLHSTLVKDFSRLSEIEILPLVSSGCFLGDSKSPPTCCKMHDAAHRCCEDFISVTIQNAIFRIFLAPALGQSSEDQRQATYKRMQESYLSQRQRGLQPQLSGWHPALLERPSEDMAHAASEEQAFIRVCVFWFLANDIQSMQRYAVEVLALLVARKCGQNTKKSISSIREDVSASKLDLKRAFLEFLEYCADLQSVRKLCEIESPATYISPFLGTSLHVPILLDRFNPYCNLLESVTPEDMRRISDAARGTLRLVSNKSDEPLLNQVFAESLRSPSRGKCFLRWTVLGFAIVILGSYICWTWYKSSGGMVGVIADMRNDFDRLQVQLVESCYRWQEIGSQMYRYIHQLIKEQLKDWYS